MKHLSTASETKAQPITCGIMGPTVTSLDCFAPGKWPSRWNPVSSSSLRAKASISHCFLPASSFGSADMGVRATWTWTTCGVSGSVVMKSQRLGASDGHPSYAMVTSWIMRIAPLSELTASEKPRWRGSSTWFHTVYPLARSYSCASASFLAVLRVPSGYSHVCTGSPWRSYAPKSFLSTVSSLLKSRETNGQYRAHMPQPRPGTYETTFLITVRTYGSVPMR
mmetsp:Transcript_9316/g.28867  ORF Transcript_9316/g.28867 Transcript_9316/m.28867 type:complete len:223 (-) Transcript_9316:324-992(-)